MIKEPLIVHQARWIIPVEGPVISQGAVVVAGNRIADVGPVTTIKNRWPNRGPDAAVISWYDHGDGAIIPALVNTHVHLEFTALRQSIPPQANVPDWLTSAIAAYAKLSPGEIESGVREGIAQLRRYGTALGAEVSNTGMSLPFLAESGFDFHYFYECLGFDLLAETPLQNDFPFLAREQVESLPVSAAAHAPYSVSGPLFHRIKAWNRQKFLPTAVHLAESLEEIHFLRHGNGPLRELLDRRRRWHDDFIPPGCSPAVYLDRLEFWNEQTLAVHGVWLDGTDCDVLARRGVQVCLCPRSNLHTGAGFPDMTALRQAGVKLTLGTDSLASCPDFNLFQEMKILLDHYAEVQPDDLLAMATINGAAALQREQDLGSIKPGKKAALLFLAIPSGAPLWPGLLDAGVQGRIHWLTSNGKEFYNGA